MRLRRYVDEWWYEPDLPRNIVRVPKRLRDIDPTTSREELPRRYLGKIGSFQPSRRWVYYNRLQEMDVGYIVPVYDMRQIAARYGLSHNSQRYFRKHILPEPFDIVRRRSVHAYHWSRFTLMALDVVLKDLEKRGYWQFLKSFEDHVDLVHRGVDFMSAYYENKYEERPLSVGDKYGVIWVDD